jgi:hypothetical protein
MADDAYDEPLAAEPFEGVVIVSHPKAGGAVAVTPDSALASAERLIAAAHRARGERAD